MNGLPNYYVELAQSSDKYIVYDDDDIENDDTIIIAELDSVSPTLVIRKGIHLLIALQQLRHP